jgi:hypothetical protein
MAVAIPPSTTNGNDTTPPTIPTIGLGGVV